MSQEGVTVYGTRWCHDCQQAKQFLDEHSVPYKWIDVDQDPSGLDRIREMQNGGQWVPTIVFEDGSVLVEPSNAELAEKLAISPAG